MKQLNFKFLGGRVKFIILGLGIEEKKCKELEKLSSHYEAIFTNFYKINEFMMAIDSITVPVIALIDIDDRMSDRLKLGVDLKSREDVYTFFATINNDPDTRVRLLNFGAVTNISKPFHAEEILRKSLTYLFSNNVMKINDINFNVNLKTREIRFKNNLLSLQPKTYDLLVFLIENGGRIINRDEIMFNIFADSPNVSTRNVDTLIKQIRKETHFELIETIRGVGYRYDNTRDYYNENNF